MAAALASTGVALKDNVVCSQLGLGCKLSRSYRTSLRSPSLTTPRLPSIRCMSTDEQPPKVSESVQAKVEEQAESLKKTVEAAAAPPRKPEVSTNFFDLFAFSGPVPETVNGRLAMVGFTTALAVELASGQGLLGQLEDGGVSWFVGAALLFTLASLIPFSRGISVESKSGGIGGIFTSKAERWNGRAAMLGLVALAITEFVKGTPLI